MKKRHTVARTMLKNVGAILMVFAKTLLLLPLLAGMVWVNYTVDRSGLFHSEEYETGLAKALMQGKILAGYDSMDERLVYKELAAGLETPYDTIALGSSRVLQLREEAVGGSFLNCGMSNADYRDMLATFYLFDKAGKLPKTMILCLDPGLLYGSEEMLHPYADSALYEEFLSLRLGIPTSYTPPAENYEKYKALVSPSYLQGNIKYHQSGGKTIAAPELVAPDAVEHQPFSVKLGDGSVLYSEAYRSAGKEEVNQRINSDVYSLNRLENFYYLDPALLDLFDRFVQYAQRQGVQVVFLLPPYHPLTYYFTTERVGIMPGFFEMERWSREYAVAHNIPLYGSYNPFVGDGFTEADFFDGLHPKPETMARIFPGMQAVQADIATGHPTSNLPYGGKTVSYETAQRLVTTRYEIAPPEEMRPLPDELVEGLPSHILGRYDSDAEDAILLARYAVTKDAGLTYRFDTDGEKWVIDLRFAVP